MALQGWKEESFLFPAASRGGWSVSRHCRGGSCLMREVLSLMPNGRHACQSQLRCRPCCLAMALLIGFRAPLLGHFGRLCTSLQDVAWTR